MNKKFSLAIAATILFYCTGCAQQTGPYSWDTLHLIKPGATLTKVSGQFKFTEGPAVDKAGNIFFTDQPNDKIWEYDTAGKLSLFMDGTGRANGMYFDKTGRLIACADEQNELRAITTGHRTTVLLNQFDGHKLNGPNDLWIDKSGGIYFTDPYYQRNYWQRKKPDLTRQSVYYLAANSNNAVVADSLLMQPNGIVGTPDGSYLFVADIQASKTYRYSINKDASLSGRQLFVSQGSDGMTLDEKGNVYFTGKGVTIYNNLGKLIGNIAVPANWVGNICFGGSDRKTLFITASESVFTLQMQVKGVE